MGARALAMCAAAASLFAIGRGTFAQGQGPADLVLTNARIYTADRERSMAEALAVKGGKIVFVGSAADASSWVGPTTTVERLDDKLVLPGLIDSHIHPLDIVDLDVCNLDSRPQKSLRDLSALVRACALKYRSRRPDRSRSGNPPISSCSIRISFGWRTKDTRTIFAIPMFSRPGSWAKRFTRAKAALRTRREA